MVKKKSNKSPKTRVKSYFARIIITFLIAVFVSSLITSFLGIMRFEKGFQQRIYPGVRIDGVSVGGKTKEEVKEYFGEKSKPLANLTLTLKFEDKTATLTGEKMAVSYDGDLGSLQAYSIGRSGNFFSDNYQKWLALTRGINLTSMLKMNYAWIDETITNLAVSIDIPSTDALFQFENGKVTVFKTSNVGRRLNQEESKNLIRSYITKLGQENSPNFSDLTFLLPVEKVEPSITTENSNNYGIKDLLGVGKSTFFHSIPGRVHNVELAASRLNGHLVAPGAEFSFNEALGDVSATTGFAPAYIIKNGRTVLGDGGGVCQVSTTFFRAILSAGLPVVERRAHAYRVGYYEQDSPAGIDATVFAPSVDLKFKNDTDNYLLIQTKTNTSNYALTFEIYGTSDGRHAEITKPVIYDQTAPPIDLYQDDPTIPRGVVKQVDWSAWGGKTNFEYKVTRGDQTINKQSFYSAFQPWQAVFLRGTKE